MPRGRRATPSRAPIVARNLAGAGVAAGGLLLFTPAPASASTFATVDVPDDVWAPVITCESNGNPTAANPTSSARGLYQIIQSTWNAYGGQEFASSADKATPEQQTIVAERIYAGQGAAAWACNDALLAWESSGSPAPSAPTPAPAPEVPLATESSNDLDCADFDTAEQAQETLDADPSDPNQLDSDGDGTPCEIKFGDSSTPSAESTPQPTPAPVDEVHTVTVQPGDWLSTIAQDVGICSHGEDIRTCWEDFAAYNADVAPDPYKIYPGQVLKYTTAMAGGLPIPGGAPLEVPDDTSAGVDTPAPTPEPTPAPAGADFVHPVSGGAPITSFVGDNRGHDGYDFDGSMGQRINSASDGVVTFVGDRGDGYGLQVIVEVDGFSLRYAHLSDSSVSVNDVMVAGDQIGEMGNSGTSYAGKGGDGSHLHFEVRTGGMWGNVLDPGQWLKDRGVTL